MKTCGVMEVKMEDVIGKIYANGWNPEYIKITAMEDGIKVSGSLSRLNWGDLKVEFAEFGYYYNKEKKLFVFDSLAYNSRGGPQ